MSTGIAKSNGSQISPLIELGARLHIEPAKLLDVLKGTVIKPTHKHTPTNEEIAAFCIVANQYGLNPFTGEIHAFSSGEKGIVPIVGVDGWARIVNAHEQFDGCEFVEETDEKGKPIKTTCIMYVKGRTHPIKVTEWLDECKRGSIPWNTMPKRMLRHKAFIQGARLAFSLSGIYDEDEARDIVGRPTAQDQAPPDRRISKSDRLASMLQPEDVPQESPEEPSIQVDQPALEQLSEKPAEPAPVQKELIEPEPAKDLTTEIMNRFSKVEKFDAALEVESDLRLAMKAGHVKEPKRALACFYIAAFVLCETSKDLKALSVKTKKDASEGLIDDSTKMRLRDLYAEAQERVVALETSST